MWPLIMAALSAAGSNQQKQNQGMNETGGGFQGNAKLDLKRAQIAPSGGAAQMIGSLGSMATSMGGQTPGTSNFQTAQTAGWKDKLDNMLSSIKTTGMIK